MFVDRQAFVDRDAGSAVLEPDVACAPRLASAADPHRTPSDYNSE